MGQTKGSMDPGVLEQRQAQRREKAQKRARANEAQSLQSSNLGRGLQESPTIKENRLRSEGKGKHADTTEDETDEKKQPKKQPKKKRKADAPKIQKKRKKKNESSSSSDSDSDSGGDSDSDETATKLIPQLLELLKKDKTKRKKKKSKKEKKKRKKHKKDSEDEESEDEKVAQKFIQSASRKPTPCSTKRRDPVEAQLNAQKRAKGVRFGINTMSFMVLLPKNYDKNTKGNDRGGMCRLVELVRGANRHGGASRAGAE
jgi:hypothetical protein